MNLAAYPISLVQHPEICFRQITLHVAGSVFISPFTLYTFVRPSGCTVLCKYVVVDKHISCARPPELTVFTTRVWVNEREIAWLCVWQRERSMFVKCRRASSCCWMWVLVPIIHWFNQIKPRKIDKKCCSCVTSALMTVLGVPGEGSPDCR